MVFKGDDLASYDAALDAWGRWEDRLLRALAFAHEDGVILLDEDNAIDVCGDDGKPLRCLRLFVRQMIVAAEHLLPDAKLTLDGSGEQPAVLADAWGSALEAEASRFKPAR